MNWKLWAEWHERLWQWIESTAQRLTMADCTFQEWWIGTLEHCRLCKKRRTESFFISRLVGGKIFETF